MAAVELLDEVGLDALTTRRLAAKLGVQAGALYRHYPSKQALLDAVAGHLMGEPADPALPDARWDDVLRAAAAGARAAMLAHRDGARLLTAFQVPPEVGVRSFRRLVDAVVAAGANEERAVRAVDTLFAYVNGFTIEEQARGGERGDGFRAGVDLILAGIRAETLEAADPRSLQ